MEVQTIINIIIGQVVLYGVGFLITFKLLQYKVEENKKALEATNIRVDNLEKNENGFNREIGEMKTLLNTTHLMVQEIYQKMFHTK